MSPADILTIDGQIPETFHILIPRWRLTKADALHGLTATITLTLSL
jgi:hypothetical protein